MDLFIGTKMIKAVAMNRQDYNNFRNWNLPENEDGDDAGYLVEYLDGGKPNVEGFAGYVSWSPEEQFNNAYRPVTGMNFGLAIEALKQGHKVQRQGWNGKGQFVAYMPSLYLPPFSSQEPGAKVNDRTAKHIGNDTPLDSQPYFALFTSQGKWQPGWVPSTSDCLADDWQIVE